jgi:hypothetical protein
MLRALFVAAAIAAAAGLTPAFAQSKASCEDVCLKGRCAAGNVEFNQTTCMTKCVQACNMARAKAK